MWQKIPKDELYKAEAFLRAQEEYCVGACARFLRIKESKGHVWRLKSPEPEITALLLHHRQALFPVFNKKTDIPGPRFLNRFLGKVQIHAIQGLKEDAELLERLMESQRYYATERIDYDLMSLNEPPRLDKIKPASRGLVIRHPLPEDTEDLFKLQAAYEQEEVVPKTGAFDPASCRLNLSRLLSNEYILVAELDGQVIGKINTSSKSFTRYQIGGVYIRPDCRGRGIAAKMTAVFVQNLLTKAKGITLFVKKRNAPARAVYRKLGFRVLGDYRISYY